MLKIKSDIDFDGERIAKAIRSASNWKGAVEMLLTSGCPLSAISEALEDGARRAGDAEKVELARDHVAYDSRGVSLISQLIDRGRCLSESANALRQYGIRHSPRIEGMLAGERKERNGLGSANPHAKGSTAHAEWEEGLNEWWNAA